MKAVKIIFERRDFTVTLPIFLKLDRDFANFFTVIFLQL